MLVDIVKARATGDRRLFVRFSDGAAGEIDLTSFVRFDGVFASLLDPAVFAQARVNAELGTVVWPNGADLCPDVLHRHLTGQPLPGSVIAA